MLLFHFYQSALDASYFRKRYVLGKQRIHIHRQEEF